MYNRLLKILTIVGLLSFLFPSYSWAQERHFIQFVFQGDALINAAEVDSILRSHNDVYMSRTDVNTLNYLAICANETAFIFIEDYFSNLGVGIKCKNSGVHGLDVVEPLDPRKCGFQQIGKEEK